MSEIKYIKHKKIDLIKWDACIENSPNGLIYPYAFFLNAMAGKKWDALVLGDYEAVFPLVWNRKFFIKYLYQPYFCQQLGLFSKNQISENLITDFIDKIPSKFLYWNFHLNYQNQDFSPSVRFVNRTSFSINLNQDYTEIYDQYNADAKKNLAKSMIQGFSYHKDIDIDTVADCFFNAYGQHYPKVESLKLKITNCASEALKQNKGFCRAVLGNDGSLWCAGFFFISNNRIHYAMAAPTDEGKKYGATHILIDEVLKEYSNKNIIFDFEGSDIKSVAYFYSKFGSVSSHYLQIIKNKLPWWLKFLKD